MADPENDDALRDKLIEIFSGMPCTNRETAAEKVAAHEWLKKRRASLRGSTEKTLKILNRETEKLRRAGKLP